MRNLLPFLVFIITISCTSVRQDRLPDDEIVKSTFSPGEIEDLSKILSFFDQQISMRDKGSEKSPDESYQRFFKELSEVKTTGDLSIPIDFKKQNDLYTELNESTLKQIWSYGWIVKWGTTDTLKNMQLNRDGKFAKFLKKSGENNRVIKKYAESLEIAGEISPAIIGDLLKNYSNYDMNDPKIRLMVAIHYLTLNDQWNRKEKY